MEGGYPGEQGTLHKHAPAHNFYVAVRAYKEHMPLTDEKLGLFRVPCSPG